jgi:hypothetical protein
MTTERSWFHRVVCLDLLDPAAPFLLFLRKIVLLNGAVVGALSSIFFVMNIGRAVSPGFLDRDRTIVAMSGQVVLVATSFVAYGNAVRTGLVPDWAIALQMYGSGIGGLISLPTGAVWPWNTATLSFAIFALICDMPLRGPFFVLLAAIFWISSFNFIYVTQGMAPPVAVPGTPIPPTGTQIRDYATVFILLVVPIVGCMLQAKHHRRMLDSAEAANALSREVAELLRNYDTAGVQRALADYGDLPHADPALIESYEALVENLNQYRPHLPNWMVNQCDEDSASHRSESSAVSGSASVPAARKGGQRSKNPSSDGRVSNSSKTSRSSVTVADDRKRVDHLNAGVLPKAVPVAFAVVDFAIADGQSADSRGATMSRFADKMHSIATATHCAIHSFVGDTAQLSWNATVRVAQPEVKAVRFLCRLKDAMAAVEHVTVAGAAMHGKATTQFAGTSTVQALAISLPWRAQLRALAALAARHGAMVCCDATAKAASHACLTRPVDVVAVAGAALTVHEVLKERDDDNDEWMYVLAKTGGDAVTSALLACTEGNYGDAVAALEDVTDDTALVHHLRNRAEAALLHPPNDFAESVCACGV